MSSDLVDVEQRAYVDSVRRTVPEVVDALRRALGATLVAKLAGVTETRTVREWAEAMRRPSRTAEQRLRLAHRIVAFIGQLEGDDVAATWFQGMNPQLGDRSPARVLGEEPFDEAGGLVLAAASNFVHV